MINSIMVTTSWGFTSLGSALNPLCCFPGAKTKGEQRQMADF